MPIRLTRTRAGKWYAAGTVRVGKKAEHVPEHSTGFAGPEKEAAEDYCRAETVRIQQELIHGKPSGRDRVSWLQAVERYQGVVSYVTEPRILKFTEQFGHMTLDEITADEWGVFERAHLAGYKQSTVNDYRGLMRKILTDAGFTPPPDLRKALARKKPRPRPPAWLIYEEAGALTACYAPHARPVALTARYQGMRAGELARLEFRDLDFERETEFGKTGAIFVRETKNARARTIPMHPRVRGALWQLYCERQVGRVFLTPSGKPYRDTRETGGNPFKRTHEGAVRRCVKLYPGVQGFRFHDWRHHFAIEAIRSGMDIVTLKAHGGWESLEAMEKYVHVDFDHMAMQLRRVR